MTTSRAQVEGVVSTLNSEDPLRFTNTVWDDLRFPVTQTKRGSNDLPDFDFNNIGLLFPSNKTDEIVYIVAQMPHAWATGTPISPHVHLHQGANSQYIFKLEYKWSNIGEAIPAQWVPLTSTGYAITPYPGGTIHQLLEFPAITPPANITGVSSILQIKLWRDDVVAGDVLVTEFDIHYQLDSVGSRSEYDKTSG